MGLEWINLFSVGGFTFFLLIIAVGYYTIEVVFGKYYLFRYIFREYNNNLFDRALHYVVWGMVVNVLFFAFFYKTGDIDMLVKAFNAFGKSADALAVGWVSPDSLQFIIFGCYYFFILVTLLSALAFGIHVLPRISAKVSPYCRGGFAIPGTARISENKDS